MARSPFFAWKNFERYDRQIELTNVIQDVADRHTSSSIGPQDSIYGGGRWSGDFEKKTCEWDASD